MSNRILHNGHTKTIQHEDYTFEAEKGPYMTENDSEIGNPVS